jgi:lipopolysaccharide transport system permease protein
MRHLFLLRELVRRDLKARYAGSLFGFLWAFVQPLWQLVLFTVVFSSILRVPLVGERTDRFAYFLFAGLLPWLAFSEGVSRGTTAVVDNSNLVKKLQFPSQLLVAAVVVSALVHEAVALLVFAAILLMTGSLPAAGLLALAPAVVLQITLTLGLGLLVAGLQVYLRDTAQFVGIVLSAWFYLTPIVYPWSLVPEGLRGTLALNPLSSLVQLYRHALLGSALPSTAALASTGVVAVALLALGATVFRRLARRFGDEL